MLSTIYQKIQYNLTNAIPLNTGELDPERIGSGIQYGDATLRRLNQGQSQRPKAGTECMGSSCRI